MCGRYILTASADDLADLFGVDAAAVGPLAARYNIAPTQRVPVVRHAGEDGSRQLVLLRWGLIPGWSRDASIGARMINARAETVAAKPAFRDALRGRRCLVVADGFYEWSRTGKRKQPFLIRARDGRPFAFAGLWERWRSRRDTTEEVIESCTIITTTANELVGPLHDRMPVILAAEDWDAWLDPAVRDGRALGELLRPAPADLLETRPVSAAVNDPRNDGPECIEPL